MIYGKITNGVLEIPTYIELACRGRIIGINDIIASHHGLKIIIYGNTPNYPYTETYTETDTHIIVDYQQISTHI